MLSTWNIARHQTRKTALKVSELTVKGSLAKTRHLTLLNHEGERTASPQHHQEWGVVGVSGEPH